MDLDKLHTQLEQEEGPARLLPYRDTIGKLTIGIGHNLTDCGISTHVAEELYTEDVAKAIRIANAYVPSWPHLDDVRQRVLVSLAFNLGHRLGLFTNMLAALQTSDYATAADALQASLWYHQVGTRGPKLVGMLRTGLDPTP